MPRSTRPGCNRSKISRIVSASLAQPGKVILMDRPACTRRRVLGAGLAAAVLPWLPAANHFAQSMAKTGDATKRRVFLFLDWFHVQKGELKVTLDPQRISTEGKKLLEKFDREFHRKFEQSGHGFK